MEEPREGRPGAEQPPRLPPPLVRGRARRSGAELRGYHPSLLGRPSWPERRPELRRSRPPLRARANQRRGHRYANEAPAAAGVPLAGAGGVALGE